MLEYNKPIQQIAFNSEYSTNTYQLTTFFLLLKVDDDDDVVDII